MLIATYKALNGEFQYAEWGYSDCHYAECHYTECRYTESNGANEGIVDANLSLSLLVCPIKNPFC